MSTITRPLRKITVLFALYLAFLICPKNGFCQYEMYGIYSLPFPVSNPENYIVIFYDEFNGGHPGQWNIQSQNFTNTRWAWPNNFAYCYVSSITGGSYLYGYKSTNYMEKQNVNLNNYINTQLQFYQVVDTHDAGDYFAVLVKDQFDQWHEIYRDWGIHTDLSWQPVQLDLSQFDGQTDISIRFLFKSNDDDHVGWAGYYKWNKEGASIDNVILLTQDCNTVTHDSVSICEGGAYVFGAQTLTNAGNYEETFQTVEGCDSVVTLTLTVNPTYDETDAATICEGDSYTFGSQTLTTTGDYEETFQTVEGCDSVVTLTLTVNPTYDETDAATICEGDSYTFGSQTLTTTGDYEETFQTVEGCDSVVTLTLKVNPTYDETDAATICEGDSYTFGSQTLTTAGDYEETFQTVEGCDSVVTFTLTVDNCSGTCKADLPYSQDFSGGALPSCWEIDDLQGNGQVWEFDNPRIRTINTTTSNNGLAILDSDNYGVGNSQNCDLISPSFDFNNYTNIILEFEHYFWFLSGSSATVSYSIDDGSSWNTIQSWSVSTTNATSFSQDLTTEVAGYSNVMFKWNYIGSWSWYWAIDDIAISADQTVPIDETLENTTYSNGESDCVDAQQTITVAGSGSVVLESGSDVNFIAGHSINFLPGFHAQSGSYIDAHITTTGSFCDQIPQSIVAISPIAKKSINSDKDPDLQEEFVKPSMKVYPNPNNGQFIVELENCETGGELVLINSLGAIVFSTKTNANTTLIELTAKQQGIYFVRTINGNELLTKKIIIQ